VPRASTAKKLEMVKIAVENTFGRCVSDADTRSTASARDILPRSAQYISKGLHNAHRIGQYWTHIPECKEQAVCKEFEVIEDLRHILVGCKSPG
jgi:hypothetical protein